MRHVGNTTIQIGEMKRQVGDFRLEVGYMTFQVGDMTIEVGNMEAPSRRYDDLSWKHGSSRSAIACFELRA
jgi:hypothetical protein